MLKGVGRVDNWACAFRASASIVFNCPKKNIQTCFNFVKTRKTITKGSSAVMSSNSSSSPEAEADKMLGKRKLEFVPEDSSHDSERDHKITRIKVCLDVCLGSN
jgi:hypothetical protein